MSKPRKAEDTRGKKDAGRGVPTGGRDRGIMQVHKPGTGRILGYYDADAKAQVRFTKRASRK
jgi:hypothetical protein